MTKILGVLLLLSVAVLSGCGKETIKGGDYVHCEHVKGAIMTEEGDARAIDYGQQVRAFEYKSSCRKPK